MKRCRHQQSARKAGDMRIGGAFTFGGVEWRHVCEWCQKCGAIRWRTNDDMKWGKWNIPGEKEEPHAD